MRNEATVLLVDDARIEKKGHHFLYLKGLIEAVGRNVVLALPERTKFFSCRQVIAKRGKGIFGYARYVYILKRICEKEKIDVIHFAYGDILYRYFGCGLSLFKGIKVVATFHQMRMSPLKKVSYKQIMRHMDRGIVHTRYLKECCDRCGITRMYHIEYPKLLNDVVDCTRADCRMYYGIYDDSKVLLALGEPRFDKGLDILLEALVDVHRQFTLLIAGGRGEFDEKFIFQYKQKCQGSIVFYHEVLTDEKLDMAVGASDIVVLPYRKIFDGASGPLVEGVWRGKMIVGPNHGSLGDMIVRNHLGLVFETENVKDLSSTIDKALGMKWQPEKKYWDYREQLDVKTFWEKYRKIYFG